MFHRHKWQAVAVWEGTKIIDHVSTNAAVTLVLYFCHEDNEVRVERLDGHWTLEQVLGTRNEQPAVRP